MTVDQKRAALAVGGIAVIGLIYLAFRGSTAGAQGGLTTAGPETFTSQPWDAPDFYTYNLPPGVAVNKTPPGSPAGPIAPSSQPTDVYGSGCACTGSTSSNFLATLSDLEDTFVNSVANFEGQYLNNIKSAAPAWVSQYWQ